MLLIIANKLGTKNAAKKPSIKDTAKINIKVWIDINLS